MLQPRDGCEEWGWPEWIHAGPLTQRAAGGSHGLRGEEDVGPEPAQGTGWGPTHPARTVGAAAVHPRGPPPLLQGHTPESVSERTQSPHHTHPSHEHGHSSGLGRPSVLAQPEEGAVARPQGWSRPLGPQGHPAQEMIS